jgi:hypothetical protein
MTTSPLRGNACESFEEKPLFFFFCRRARFAVLFQTAHCRDCNNALDAERFQSENVGAMRHVGRRQRVALAVTRNEKHLVRALQQQKEIDKYANANQPMCERNTPTRRTISPRTIGADVAPKGVATTTSLTLCSRSNA